MAKDKRPVGPMEIVVDPPAPVEAYTKLLKAVAALTLEGHTVSVFAKPHEPDQQEPRNG